MLVIWVCLPNRKDYLRNMDIRICYYLICKQIVIIQNNTKKKYSVSGQRGIAGTVPARSSFDYIINANGHISAHSAGSDITSCSAVSRETELLELCFAACSRNTWHCILMEHLEY